jgi:nucleoid DNA-binding protein
MLENMDRAIKKDNPVKLATFGTEDTRWRQKKNNLKTNAVCFGDHYMQTNTKPAPDFPI